MSFIHGVLARNDYLNNIINLGTIVLLLPMRMKLMKINFCAFYFGWFVVVVFATAPML